MSLHHALLKAPTSALVPASCGSCAHGSPASGSLVTQGQPAPVSTLYRASSLFSQHAQASASGAAAPMAALSLSDLSFGKAKKQFNSIKDRVYYGDILPPVGSQELSYARFMDMIHDKLVKRVIILADGKVAMVELPVEGYASKLEEARFNRQDET